MKVAKTPSPLPATKTVPLPYSRLVLHVACLAAGGWLLLDAHSVSATWLSWGAR